MVSVVINILCAPGQLSQPPWVELRMVSSEAAREEIRGEIRLDCAEGARRGAPEKAKDGWLDTKVTRPSSQGPWGEWLRSDKDPRGPH